MGLTLFEASKLNSGEVKRNAVIRMFAETSDLMRAMPFINITGGSLVYNVEGSLPGVAFRGYNQTYTPTTGVINNAVETLKIIGGYLDVDIAMIKTRGAEVRTSQEEMQIRGLGLNITDSFINGNSATDIREFDGLRYRVASSQLIPALLTSPTGNSPLSLEALDSAIDQVFGATHLVMSFAMQRKLFKAHRSGVGGDVNFTTDQFGYRVQTYNGLPILIADYNHLGQRIIDFDEAGPAGGSTSSSIYVVRFGDGFVTGIQNGPMEVKDLGELQTDPIFRTRVEWLVGMAVMHGRACARVWGITNSDVTT